MTTALLEPDDGFADLLDATYSGEGPMATPAEVLEDSVRDFILQAHRLSVLRHDLAVSGAMRWPWSQEAPISTRLVVRVG